MILGLDTPLKLGIFVLYVTISTLYGLFNDNARLNGIQFNKLAIVLVQNCLKLFIAGAMYLRMDGNFNTLIYDVKKSKNLLMLYLIPAGLYAAYDCLGYYNLSQVDSPTYFIVMQVRILVTAFIHQYVFQKKLNKNNWIGLFLVMGGVVVQVYGKSFDGAVVDAKPTPFWIYGSILFQVLLTSTAGVVNEKFLKGAEISANLQNMYMYSCSMALLVVTDMVGLIPRSEPLTSAAFNNLLDPSIFPLVIIMSTMGITTGYFLKILDSIRKTIANATEIVLLAILSSVFFDTQFTVYLAMASTLIAGGIYNYSKPVVEAEQASNPTKPADIEMQPTETVENLATA